VRTPHAKAAALGGRDASKDRLWRIVTVGFSQAGNTPDGMREVVLIFARTFRSMRRRSWVKQNASGRKQRMKRDVSSR
jgi:hypothetical protein